MTNATLRTAQSICSPRWAAILACSLAAACSGEDPASTTSGVGGATTGSGSGGDSTGSGSGGDSTGSSSGGASAQGGATGRGGATGQGGAATSGGATGQGGAATNGGATGQGGAATNGGATGQGGAGTQGGAATKGGATGQGGATTKGGATGQGGNATPTGGRATGGQTSAVGGATSGGTAAGGAGVGGSSGCVDSCPFANGITWQCKKRFFYGLNQAWVNFASDFGGGTRGIAANTSRISTLFQNYSNNGASVIRWWIWPNFTGGGVAFSGNNATGLKSTTLADLEALMKLADQHNLYLQLTPFSFDNFKTTANPNLAAIAVDATARAAMVTNAIRPLARAVQASAYAKRVISWDVINEPEWAVSGAGVNGDEAFTPNTACTTITQPQMATLLKDVVAGLRAESQALITIGNAAMKWKNAWLAVDQDFYTYHIYDWVQQYWPYNRSPTQYGVSAKPVVMGEFPPAGLNSGAISYSTLMSSWYTNGYAGGLPWQDTSMVINWTNFKAFADQHPCETRY